VPAPALHPSGSPAAGSAIAPRPEESVPVPSVPGRSFIAPRAMLDLVRAAVLGCYGVTGLVDRSVMRRVLARLGVPGRGIALTLDHGIAIDLSIAVGHGLPIAEVARQVDSAVRYAIHHATGREVARLVIHVNGLRVSSAGPAEATAPRPAAEAAPVVQDAASGAEGAGG